ncbi:TrbC/VirB2 family protein [Candidatus Uhrbacteria bacterium]|nr:TrbC/VirB2 family protein [Candidatus Uhrbacteria bacterium]
MSRAEPYRTVFFLTLLGVAAVVAIGFFFPESANAQIPASIVPQCDWEKGQTYGLGAFILLASNIMKLIWGITGTLALVMFIWGGFQWLTAAGEESRVKAGWDTFINATIGILIVLGSWVIINTLILFLVSPGTGFTAANLFGRASWVEIATKDNTVCIDSAKLARGYVPPPPTITAKSEGICCYNTDISGSTGRKSRGEFEQTTLEACKIKDPVFEIVFCPNASDDTVCGEKEYEVSSATRAAGVSGPFYWKNIPDEKCKDKIVLTPSRGRIANGGNCNSHNECISGRCDPIGVRTTWHGNEPDDRCVEDNENGTCCIATSAYEYVTVGTTKSRGNLYKMTYGEATTRKGCRMKKFPDADKKELAILTLSGNGVDASLAGGELAILQARYFYPAVVSCNSNTQHNFPSAPSKTPYDPRYNFTF